LAVPSDLSVSEVVSGYTPGIDVVRGATLRARAGVISAVIGPNGAGKSTLLKTIFGFLQPTAGSIVLDGIDLTGLPPHRRKRLGMGYIPQEINIFPSLSVEENLKMGAWTLRRQHALVAERLAEAYAMFPALARKQNARASSLSGGQARMLSVAREMMNRPRLMLVDEPTAGLAPAIVPQIYAVLTEARKLTNAAIVLVDQNIEGALGVADEVYLLALGRVRAHGPAAEFPLERTRELIKECLRG
jgi:ABC-type branched-subunit amino acid transport system ATPase component